MEKTHITIVGAGVVGLAIAHKLSTRFKDIMVVEKHPSYGQEASSRNSEVIHAGIYYPPGSLKHLLCVQGNSVLYLFCEENNIPYRQIGKLIVATSDDEEELLEALYKNAITNGVELKKVSGKKIQEMEPDLKTKKVIFSPTTGIVDSHSLMRFLHFKAAEQGVTFSFNTEVKSIYYTGGSYIVDVDGLQFQSEIVINSSGLASADLARTTGIQGYQIYPCKGTYFKYQGKHNIRHLIYPVPKLHHKGLGIHATLDMSGGLRFGPDVEFVKDANYEVDPAKLDSFYQAISRYLPNIEMDKIVPDYAGVRSKLESPGSGFRDFIIQDEAVNGFPKFINLVGIESPGLTACLAIADYVSGLVY